MAAGARFAVPRVWGPQRNFAVACVGPFRKPTEASVRPLGAAAIKTCRSRWQPKATAAVEPPAAMARALSSPPFFASFPALPEAAAQWESLAVGRCTPTLGAFLRDPHASDSASSPILLPLRGAHWPSPDSFQLEHQPPLQQGTFFLSTEEGGNSDVCTPEDECRTTKYYCWNRNPSSRYPKKANNGARPKCRVMRKIRKRLRTGR